ncbi:hypothetical protein HU200_017292 [Digitaria exilis]|uniref:Uncharacterized protein n=1 Tax=Digitaria exilis TaxID=1010633 RepID=A0A835KJB5_9POAL|nr:hypothetical protein HU200_017292 [Digitaria exilis]
MEDIGLWIPEEVSHTVYDDKPENEPEEEEIVAGPPLSHNVTVIERVIFVSLAKISHDGFCCSWQADHPKLNFKDKYSESYRDAHPNAPVVVPWMSGVVSA